MTMQNESTEKTKVLDEIINGAVELPLESQDLLLMMAKAMRYTRDYIYRTEYRKLPSQISRKGRT